MPARKRYALDELNKLNPPFTEYERSVSLQEDFVQPSPLEAELIAQACNADPEGLDPVERQGRQRHVRYTTEAERALACARILPHRSTITGAMQLIHERRFALWLAGLSYQDIAEIEDVDATLILRSVGYQKVFCLGMRFTAPTRNTRHRAHILIVRTMLAQRSQRYCGHHRGGRNPRD